MVSLVFVEKMEDSEASPNKRQKTAFGDSDKSSEEPARSGAFLQGSHIHILEAGIGKVRSELFRTKIAEFGGALCSDISDRPDILLVDEQMTADRLFRLLKISGPQQLEGVVVVCSTWLSACIKDKKLLPTESYRLPIYSVVLSSESNLSTSQQPKLSQTTIPQCSNLSHGGPDEGLDADSNCIESGEDDGVDEDSVIFKSQATIQQLRPLPVCLLFYGYFLFICNNAIQKYKKITKVYLVAAL